MVTAYGQIICGSILLFKGVFAGSWPGLNNLFVKSIAVPVWLYFGIIGSISSDLLNCGGLKFNENVVFVYTFLFSMFPILLYTFKNFPTLHMKHKSINTKLL